MYGIIKNNLFYIITHMSVVRSHSLSVGIVGLPNAGKSTLFNSLTKISVPAENFPFTTIDKNVGVVEIPDKRLDMMNEFFSAQKRVPSAIKFVDIAGLVKGASKGEGLGNQFLSHIREVDVIMYVIRSFVSESIVHVYNRVKPSEDLQIVQSELILKDIETIERKIGEIKKFARNGINKDAVEQLAVYEFVYEKLGNGTPVSQMGLNKEQKEIIRELFLLSDKKMMYVLNIREGMDENFRKEWMDDIKTVIPNEDHQYIIQADVKLIGELSDMNEVEQEEYLSMLDTKPTHLTDIINTANDRLNLLTFYTGSEKEVNSWTIGKGATIKEAAGVIHTDLGNTFITADVINVERLIAVGGWNRAKETGEIKNYGKDYLIQDGDYIIVYSSK